MSSTQEVGEIFGKGTGPAHAMLRSPTVLIASVGLWGMNVYFFRLFGINYVKVLQYDLLLLQEQEDAASKQAPAVQQGTGGEGGEEEYLYDHLKGGAGSHFHPSHHPHPPGESSSSSLTHHQSQSQQPQHHRKTFAAEPHPHHHTLELPSINKKESTTTTTSTTIAEDTRKLMDYNSEDDDYNYYDDYYYDNNNDFAERRHPQTSSAASYNRLYPTTEDDRITWSRLVSFSLSLLFLLHITYYLWIDVWGGNQLGAVFGFYGVVTTVIAVPLSSTRWLRKATVLVLQRSFELINPRCWCLVSPSSSSATSLSEASPLYQNGKQQQQPPQPSLYHHQHQQSLLLRGPRPIPFVDVFFADAMCSLSKVFFDWGMLLVMASHYPYPVPATTQNIVIPSLCAAIPFCIRARQCLIMYQHGAVRHDPKRFSHLWNALKYSTSIFPLIVSVIQKTVLENNNPKQAKALEKYLILLLVINALYALYWDIVMDWGMMQNPSAAAAVAAVGCCGTSMSGTGGTGGLCAIGSCGSCCSSCCRRRSCVCCTGKHASVTVPSSTLSSSAVVGSGVGVGVSGKPMRAGKSSNSTNASTMNCWYAWLRPRLRFGIAMSAMIVLADCILRFGWTLRFYKRLFPSGDSFVLCTQFLEVFRRAIWNLLRVEWENSKQAKAKSQASLASATTPGTSSTTTGGTASPATITTASSSSVSGVGGSSNNNGASSSSSSSMTGATIGPLSSLTAVATSSVRHLVPNIVDDNETGSGSSSSSSRVHELASLVTASGHPKVATA